jgi:hypothetical protein
MHLPKPRWNVLFESAQRYVIPLVALLLIGLVYFLGIRSERTGFVNEVLDPGLKRITHPVLNAFRGRPPVVSQLLIGLEESDADSLVKLQDRILETGWLDAVDNLRLPVSLTIGEQDLAGILSMHEGPVDRNSGKRWSYRVLLPPRDTLLGMRSFDLMPVSDAAPVYGRWLHAALRDLELPALGNALVELKVKGKDLGLYLMEGRADSSWIADQGHGNAAVLRFDDALQIHARRGSDDLLFPMDPNSSTEWMSAPILASQLTNGFNAPDAMQRTMRAVEALEGFRAGKLPAKAVFDAVSVAKFLAVCDILGAQATINWWNLRFIPDSLSGKVIIFPQRLLAGSPITSILPLRGTPPWNPASPPTDLTGILLADAEVYSLYITWLNILSAPAWRSQLGERHATDLNQWDRIVRGEYPSAQLDQRILDHCSTVAQRTLHPREPVLAYTQFDQGGSPWIAVSNVHDLPISINATIVDQDTIHLGRPVMIRPRERGKPLTYTRLPLTRTVERTTSVSLLTTVVGLEHPIVVASRVRSTFVADR